MTLSWITKHFVGGAIAISPPNPAKNLKAALKIETSGPHREIYLRGDQVQALVDFLLQNKSAVDQVIQEQL